MARENKLNRIAAAIGLADGESVAGAVQGLTARLGLPTSLGQVGVARELFARIVDGALKDHSHKTNPRDASAEDYARMLDAAF